MRKIIGGEFKIPFVKFNSFFSTKNYFSSGRAALFGILSNINKEETKGIQLPNYLCSSITQTIIDFGLNYTFYKIDKDTLLPNEQEILNKSKKFPIILLINYFGLVSNDLIIENLKKHNLIVILDNVQNYYGYKDNKLADYSFTSFRKWFAVPDGADVYSKKKDIVYPNKENIFAQYKLAGSLLKNFSNIIDDSIALDLLNKGEKILDSDYYCECSKITKLLITKLNFNKINKRRKRNAAFLHKELEKIGIKHLYNKKLVPLFIPIFIHNRDHLRTKMFSKNIFTPIHWPYENSNLNGDEINSLYDTELSLICDQRYSIKDMKEIVEVLKSEY